MKKKKEKKNLAVVSICVVFHVWSAAFPNYWSLLETSPLQMN